MLMLRAVIDLFAVAAFAGASFATMLVIDPNSGLSYLLFIDVLWLIVMIRVVAVVLRAILAPRTPGLRLLPIGDAVAMNLHWQLLAVAILALILRLHSSLLNDFGVPMEVS